MFRTMLTGVIALSATLAIVASANAEGTAVQGQTQGATIKLQYTQAELHSAQGAKALARRIREAAVQSCSAEAPYADALVVESECREAAINRAIRDLNSPLVADALGRSPTVLAKAGH
jgi:UrcA family protein